MSDEAKRIPGPPGICSECLEHGMKSFLGLGGLLMVYCAHHEAAARFDPTRARWTVEYPVDAIDWHAEASRLTVGLWDSLTDLAANAPTESERAAAKAKLRALAQHLEAVLKGQTQPPPRGPVQ